MRHGSYALAKVLSRSEELSGTLVQEQIEAKDYHQVCFNYCVYCIILIFLLSFHFLFDCIFVIHPPPPFAHEQLKTIKALRTSDCE